MTKTQPSWVKCLSANMLGEALLSCSECRAFEYRKCDGCPNSDFAVETLAPCEDDPMNSVTTHGWIRGIAHTSLSQ
jgi:hypothetical protein